jgi:hypothetical protein
MNMSKHTPGPWKCDLERKGDRVFPFTINGADHDPLARCITKVDAALISAAPELLTALKRLVSAVEKYAPCPEDWEELREAHNAIATAEGLAV